MKKKLTLLLAILCALAVSVSLAACNDPQPTDYGTLTIADVTLRQNQTQVIEPVFTKEAYPIEYTYSGTDISISDDGVVTGVTAGTSTVVVARTEHHAVTFTVAVLAKGTMTVTVPDIVYLDYPAKELKAEFSVPAYAQDVTYEVKGVPTGASVTVADGKISATGSLVGTGETVSQTVTLVATSADGLFKVTKPLTIAQYNGAGWKGGSLNMHTRPQGFLKEMEAYSGVEGGEKGGTLFIGDSFFDGYWNAGNFRSYYEGENVYRFGVSSSTLADWLIFAERVVFPFEPKHLVVH